MWLIKYPLTQLHSVVLRKVEHILIFIQPLIDPLLIHSVGPSVGEKAILLGSWKASHPGSQSASEAAGLKCGKYQPHWPTQDWDFFCSFGSIMGKTTQCSAFTFIKSQSVSKVANTSVNGAVKEIAYRSTNQLINTVCLLASYLVSHSASQWFSQPGIAVVNIQCSSKCTQWHCEHV